jgi:hypothetical protein
LDSGAGTGVEGEIDVATDSKIIGLNTEDIGDHRVNILP